MWLVGDIGGTNARLALADDQGIRVDSLRKLAGQDYARFDAALADYLAAAHAPRIEAVCIAVAGPVWDGQARLTNRDWAFSEADLRAQTGAGRAVLINDMIALGHATARAPLRMLHAAPPDRPRNGQVLVVNAGTGFNICPVHRANGHTVCLEAEAGHVSLPESLRAALAPLAAPPSVEELFSGRGLGALHQSRTNARVDPHQIAAAASPETRATMDLAARLFGLLLRDLAMAHLPREGIVLAGSAARSLAAHDPQAMIAAYLSQPFLRAIPESVPISVLDDDMAALTGCLAALAQRLPAEYSEKR